MFRLSQSQRRVLFALVALTAISAILGSGVCIAQTDRATLAGSVTDPSQSAIPGVTVEAVSKATGLRRSTASDEKGAYTIAGLPIGRVTVTFSKAGFQSLVYSEIELTVGQSRTANARLELASVATQIDVQAAPPPLSQTSAEISGVIQSEQLKSMPLNGRSWQGLLALSPGAINTGTGNASGVRFAGRSPDDNFFRLDGVDASGISNLTPQTNPRLAIPLESISEFRVNSAFYTAESGGSLGGQVDIVSRSGSNDFHGSLFEYLRNDKLDSRSPFDLAGVPPFRLNQFGGSFGGAAVKDRTFFFVTYEGLRQRRGLTLIGFVPSEAFRARALSTSPALAPILDAYPRSGVLTGDPNVAQWSALGSQRQDENAGTFRVDHRFSEKTTVYFRGNVTEAESTAPIGDAEGYLRLYQQSHSGILNGVLQLQSVFSPTTLNEVKFGANRLPSTNERFNPLGIRVTIPGFTAIKEANTDGAEAPTTFSLQDNLTLIRGRHTVKAGVEIRPTRLTNRRAREGNSVTYANIADFLANRLNQAQVSADQLMTGVSKTFFGGYVQDEFKPRPGLTFNLGARYDYFGVFREDYDRSYPWDLQTCGGPCPPGSAFSFPDRNNISPRVSVAWAPQRLGGRTVVRTGFGMYYGEGQLGGHIGPASNSTSRTLLSSADIPGLSYPIQPYLALATSQGSAPSAMARDRKDMYTMQYGLLVQQSLASIYVAEAGYLGNLGRQMINSSSVNVVDPATGRRPLPEFGILSLKAYGGVSNFN